MYRRLPKTLGTIAVLLLSLTLSNHAFGQSSNATVSGTVSDGSGALIPGVSITATNVGTNIASTTVSNEAGAYNLPALLPGTYKVTAELPGFQTQTYTDVQLGNAAQIRLNFSLTVAGVNQAVEVTIAADTLLATSSSSVGGVLTENRARDLPMVGSRGNEVLNLLQTLPGVVMSDSPVLSPNSTTFAGVSAANVNIQRDGVDAGARAGGRPGQPATQSIRTWSAKSGWSYRRSTPNWDAAMRRSRF